MAGELGKIMCFHGGGKVVMGKIFQNLFIDLDFGVVLFCVWESVCMFERITFIFLVSLFYFLFLSLLNL